MEYPLSLDASGNVERFIAVPVSPSYLTEHLRSLQHQASAHMSPHTADYSLGMLPDNMPHPPEGTTHMMPRSRSPDSMVTIPPSGCTSLVSAQVCWVIVLQDLK